MAIVLDYMLKHTQDATKIAVIANGESITYRQLLQKALGFADYLRREGVGIGDMVVVQSEHSISYITAMIGSHLNKSIFVPLGSTVGIDELKSTAGKVNAKLILANVSDDYRSTSDVYHDISNTPADFDNLQLPDENDVSDLLFTTGTTGMPSGILHTHLSQYITADNLLGTLGMLSDNICMITAPLNHAFAIRRFNANMVNGSATVLIDGVFPPNAVFEAVERYGVTAITMVPSALVFLLRLTKDKIARYSKQIRYIQFATAPLSADDVIYMKSIMPDTIIYNVYGSTESGCVLSLNYTKECDRKLCLGKPTRNTEIILLDQKYNVVHGTGKNHSGFLAVRGKMNMQCYWHDDKKTAAVMQDGMVITQDIVWRDDEGFYYFLGRDGDVINVGGLKVSPTEVEEVAMACSGITDCACTAVENDLMGTVPALLVVKGEAFDIIELQETMMAKLEFYKRPKQFVYVDAIPKTYNGKINRRKLKNLL